MSFSHNLLIYLYSNLKNEHEKVTEKFKTISSKSGDMALTVYQQIERKGHLRGVEEGLDKGIKFVAINMIKKDFNNQTIIAAPNLSEDQINVLRELQSIEKE